LCYFFVLLISSCDFFIFQFGPDWHVPMETSLKCRLKRLKDIHNISILTISLFALFMSSDLRSKAITGTIPTEIGMMTQLFYL
jgi:hypothetical protein